MIVGTFSGVQQAAIYSASEKLYQAMQSVASVLSQALFPFMAKSKKSNLLFYIVLSISIPLMIFCFALSFVSSDLVSFVFGEEFREGASVFNVFLIIVIVNFISVNYGYPAFAAINTLSPPRIPLVLLLLLRTMRPFTSG